jgi:hypothetical protein
MSAEAGAPGPARGVVGALLAADPVDLAGRLCLLALLLHPVGDERVRPALLALCALGLLATPALRSAWLWLGLAGLAGARVLLDWPMSDNHGYLLAYWCLAFAVSAASRDRGAALARNARLLVGLTFAFATLWKVGLSPDFLDGRFFRVSLVVDSRLDAFGRLAGGLDPERFAEIRGFLVQHVDGRLAPPVDAPALPERYVRVAWAATLGTAVLEAALALAFLWPARSPGAPLRHALLLLFCATTYAVAPVEGFGWLLVSMGVAQCGPDARGARLGYLLAFVAILVFAGLPWESFLPHG